MTSKISKRGVLTLIVMNGISFLSAFAISALRIALPTIIEEYGVAATTGQALFTVNALASGVFMLLSPAVYARFNTRRTVLLSTLLLLLSVICGVLAPNFPVLLCSQLISGCAVGLFMPGIYLVFNKLVVREERGRVLGFISTLVAASPILAVLCAGRLTDNYGWHSIFAVLLPFALLLLFLAWRYVDDYSDVAGHIFDLRSFTLVALGCVLLLYSLTVLPDYDYDPRLLLPIALGVLCIWLFVRRQRYQSNPLLDLRVFRQYDYRYVVGLSMLNTAIGNACKIFFPILLYIKFRISSSELATLLLPASIVTAVLPYITGRFMDKARSRRLLTAGCALLACAACLLFICLTRASFAALCVFYTLFIGAVNTVAQTMNLLTANILQQPLLTHGTSIFNSSKSIAGSIGTASVSAVYGLAVAAVGEAYGIQIFFAILCALTLLLLALYLYSARRYEL